MKTEYGFLFVFPFPEEGEIETEIVEQSVVEIDGEALVVHEQSKGIVPFSEVDATLEAFRREAV